MHFFVPYCRGIEIALHLREPQPESESKLASTDLPSLKVNLVMRRIVVRKNVRKIIMERTCLGCFDINALNMGVRDTGCLCEY